MAADTTAVQALQAGRVLIRHAEILGGGHKDPRPGVVIGFVRDIDGTPYRVDLLNGGWTCKCGADGCPHVATVQYVTGYARPPAVTNLGAPAADMVRAAAALHRKAAAKIVRDKGHTEQSRINAAIAAALDDVADDLAGVERQVAS